MAGRHYLFPITDSKAPSILREHFRGGLLKAGSLSLNQGLKIVSVQFIHLVSVSQFILKMQSIVYYKGSCPLSHLSIYFDLTTETFLHGVVKMSFRLSPGFSVLLFTDDILRCGHGSGTALMGSWTYCSE